MIPVMTLAMTHIRRSGDGDWCWMVEFDNPHMGQSGRATSYAAADQIVRDIVEGKV